MRRLAASLSFLCLACVCLPLLPALAGDGPEPDPSVQPRIVERDLGEEEEIRARHEWFFAPRRQGTLGPDDMALLRQVGVEFTRERILAQRARTDAGYGETENWWVEMGPSPSHFGSWRFGDVAGRVPALAADRDSGTIWAGTASGGLWKTTNDGATWEEMIHDTGTQTVGAVAVDPNDPNVIWVGTGENTQGCEGYFGIGILRSTDGGLTWETRNGTDGQDLEDIASFASIVVDPRDSNHVVTGGRHRGCSTGNSWYSGIYTTNDAGLHWTKRLSGVSVYEIQQDPQVRDTWWAATNQGIWKSTDNAVTWTKQTASDLPSHDTGRTELAIAPSDGNVVYALFATGSSGNPEFWRTTDGGASWQLMSDGNDACDGQCWYNMTLAVHPTDPDEVYRGTVHVFRSTDGGATWTDLSNSWGSNQKVHQDTHFILVDPDHPGTFWVGCDGGVWKTTDRGETFENRNGNMNLTQFYAVGVHPSDGGIICGGAQDNSSLARTTSNVWDLQAVTGDGFVCHIDPVNPDINYISSYPSGGYPHVSRSDNGILGSYHGITGAGSGIIEGDRINWVTPYVLDPQSPNILYLGTHRVYKSTNHGDHWDPVSGDLTGGSGNIKTLDVNRNFPEVVLAGTTSGKAWISRDGGTNWEEITSGLPSREVNDLASDPTDPDHALAVVSGFNTAHLWEWRRGQEWVAIGDGLPNVPANTVIMLDDQRVFVGTDTGVFRSIDGGRNFEPFMNGMPRGTVIDDLKYNQDLDLLTAGTYGRGAWQIQVDPLGPIVQYDSIEQPLVEIDGDGDGSVEPGETWEVRPILRNVGSETASGVTARLATSTPHVTIEGDDVRAYGDIAAGQKVGAEARYRFVVDPDFPCGEEIVFDIVDIRSTNDPGTYKDAPGAFTVTVVDHYLDPVDHVIAEDDMDPDTELDWSHEAIDPGFWWCQMSYVDEWHLDQKDSGHGNSWQCGNAAGYSKTNYAWLYLGGRDSTGGAGFSIPAEAIGARLTIVHRYRTSFEMDGGQVVIDASPDGNDVYEPLEPDGGYDGKLQTGRCNGLEGKETFTGDSGGWITTTFDLSDFAGRTFWLAFVFGSDSATDSGMEGWWIDSVTLEWTEQGQSVCQQTAWPGTVPGTATFEKLADGTIRATWDDACNASEVPGQTYSIQAGDLGALHDAASWTHAPVDGRCDRTSPDTFTPGDGSEYYLVAAHVDGKEGGLGESSAGGPRPHASDACGLPREGACP